MRTAHHSRTVRVIFLALLPTLLMGCTTTVSKHPLSNEETSELNEHLIGHWQIEKFDERDKPNLAPFIVGKVNGRKHTLELVTTSLTKNDQVKVSRASVFSRSIGENQYLSLKTPRQNEVSYIIFKYELIDHGVGNRNQAELKLFAMDSDFVAKVILDKKLPGDVNWYGSPDKPSTKASWVKTTASPEQLTALIKMYPQDLFEQTPTVVLKEFKPSWQEQDSK